MFRLKRGGAKIIMKAPRKVLIPNYNKKTHDSEKSNKNYERRK